MAQAELHEELWRPSRERADATLLADFMRRVGIGVPADGDAPWDYDALWRWSIDNMEEFWTALWDHAGMIGEQGPVVLDRGAELIDARFFPEGRANYAENLMARLPEEGPVVIFHGEDGSRRPLDAAGLRALVSRIRQGLEAAGVGPGDRVAGFVPNMPETLAAMLAATSLGAVWSSASPDFGVQGVLDRFGQIEPRVLFSADGYYYNGKWFSSLPTVAELAEAMPSVEKVVVMPYAGPEARPDIAAAGEKAELLADFIAPFAAGEIDFVRVNFRDPLFIMFSSGTTGLPKCIVHSVGGSILQHLKEHRLQGDIRPGDTVFYFTTCGWMMWNWLMSTLASGARVVLYDGNPFHPAPDRLPRMAAAEGVTHFGVSAKYIDACAKAGVAPKDTLEWPALRTIFSTGSPLLPESFDYIYDKWADDVCLSSIAGGTDILSCFVGGAPVAPVYRGQCQKRQLGMDVRVFDEDGREIVGEPGELVCVGPHPSMPTGFWNDPDRRKYRAAYFERFPGVWHHGDWVELTPEGGMIFYGRSDATLNPGGVRIGTAEIYRQVEKIDDILEALVVGQDWKGDQRVILFVKMREGRELTPEIEQTIRRTIRENASPRHVPAKIIAVADIPRTKSGKIVELAVRNVIHGRPVKNVHALANPEALDLFRDLPELQAD